MNWKDLLKQAVFFCRFPLFAAAQPFVTHASRRQYSSSSSSCCRTEQLQSHFGHNSCWATQRPESLRRQSRPRPAHGHGLTLRTGASYLTFNRNMSKLEQNGFQHKIQNLLIGVLFFSPSICLICNVYNVRTGIQTSWHWRCTLLTIFRGGTCFNGPFQWNMHSAASSYSLYSHSEAICAAHQLAWRRLPFQSNVCIHDVPIATFRKPVHVINI